VVACGVGNELYWSVLEIGHVAAHCGDVLADFRGGLIKFDLMPPRDEDAGALFDKPFCGGQTDTPAASCDDRHFAFQL
jgi:hypothetical protein